MWEMWGERCANRGFRDVPKPRSDVWRIGALRANQSPLEGILLALVPQPLFELLCGAGSPEEACDGGGGCGA